LINRILQIETAAEVEGKRYKTDNLLEKINRLYKESQNRFLSADAGRESTEYWRGRTDALYAVMNLIQVEGQNGQGR